MTINKINYELYAIDYLEGVLSDELHEEMANFLLMNPDIAKELEEIRNFSLPVIATGIYPDKESLKKQPNSRRWIAILSIAASISLIICWILFTGPSSAELQKLVEGIETPIIEPTAEYPATSTTEVADELIALGNQDSQSSPDEINNSKSEINTVLVPNEQPQENIEITENKKENKIADDSKHIEVAKVELVNSEVVDLSEKEIIPAEKVSIAEVTSDVLIVNELDPLPEVITNPVASLQPEPLHINTQIFELEENRKFANSLKPEAFAKKGSWKDIKKALLPESFAGIFTKD